MANVRLPNATRTAMVTKISDLIDLETGAGTIKIYSGTQPATGGGGLAGNTLLATLTFSTTCATSITNGVITFDTITSDSSADATDTATWARIADAAGVTVFDCDVGTSGATINLNSVAITTGSTVSITSFTVTMPAT